MISCRTFLIQTILAVSTLLSTGIAHALTDGIARVHFHRMDGDYDGWGLHVWGDGLMFDRKISWGRPLMPTGTDGFGVYYDIPISPTAQRVGFIIHKGAEKNVAEDMSINVATTKEVWSIEGDVTLYTSRSSAVATFAPVQKKAEVRTAVDKANEKKEAALKAEMLAVAQKVDAEAKAKEAEALKKAEEEKARITAERDQKLAELKKKADYKLAHSEQERYAEQKRAMTEELARSAAAYAKKQNRQARGEHMSPGQIFALSVGGGSAFLIVSVLGFFFWQRRKSLSASVATA